MADVVAGRIGRRIGTLVHAVAERLEEVGIPFARQEARDLVAALLDVPRFWPSLHADSEADRDTWRLAMAASARRAGGAPFPYAVGRAPFRHLTLDVDDRVLIPRQETEHLVELVLARSGEGGGGGGGGGGLAVDVGTGSGAIALALACEGRFDRVIGTDVSLDAIDVARGNAALVRSALRAPVEFLHGSLLAPVRELRARVVVSNPPYIAVREAAALPRSVRDWEPALALFGGDDGMSPTLALVDAAAALLEPGGLLALEGDERRSSIVAEVVTRTGHYGDVELRPDLAGRDRFVLARRI